MADITYAGVTLPFAKLGRGDWIHARKEISFPGVDGVEIMAMGRRTRSFDVTGRLPNMSGSGSGLEDISIANINNLNDGDVHTLVDNLGNSHLDVIIDSLTYRNIQKDSVRNTATCTFRIQFTELQ